MTIDKKCERVLSYLAPSETYVVPDEERRSVALVICTSQHQLWKSHRRVEGIYMRCKSHDEAEELRDKIAKCKRWRHWNSLFENNCRYAVVDKIIPILLTTVDSIIYFIHADVPMESLCQKCAFFKYDGLTQPCRNMNLPIDCLADWLRESNDDTGQ